MTMNPKDHFVVGLIIYTALLWGGIESRHGEFWITCILVITGLALYHTVVCSMTNFCAIWGSRLSCLVFPSWLVAYEYLRHAIVQSYDQSGFTFFSIGQAVPLLFVQQIAGITGFWSLTLVVGIAISLHLTLRRKRSIVRYLLFAAVALAAMLTSLTTFPRKQGSNQFDRTASVLTVPFPLSVSSLDAVSAFVNSLVESEGGCTILGAETMVSLNLTKDEVRFCPEDLLWQELSMRTGQSVLVGAWINLEGRDDRINAIVQIRDGRVVGAQSKHRLAPFVESQPLGTHALVSFGWIPEETVRNATPPKEAERLMAGFPKPQGVQTGVCYDIFLVRRTWKDSTRAMKS
jgi:apolipoprotein N-acyltransferase